MIPIIIILKEQKKFYILYFRKKVDLLDKKMYCKNAGVLSVHDERDICVTGILYRCNLMNLGAMRFCICSIYDIKCAL